MQRITLLTILLSCLAVSPAAAQDQPTAEDHFDALYAGAAGRYAWRNWNGSFRKWQKHFRADLENTLGVTKMRSEMASFKPEAFQVDSEDLGTFTRERWEIRTEPDVLLPVIILRPKDIQGKTALMITPHGHSKNTEMYAGVYWNESDRSLAEDGERNIALQAVREGFIAIAPTARAFGKTRTAADLAADATSSCHDYMLHDLLVGRTPVGDRVWDIMKIIDWSLENLLVDPARIVVSGHSGGGTATLYAGAVDQRITVCMPSGAFSSYEGSIGTIRHCECNYLPGMLDLGNMGDVAGLLAGRYLCIIQGKDDGIFPIDGAREEFKKTEEIFKAAGKGECMLVVGDGGHRYYKDPAWKFIKKVFSVF
ncbi:MAG: acetylxylan esterase [Bacteroidales bacterium]|nr:acetylxylan esterase [Bacteroidales bacterium]